jgi:hypothetical protein
MATKFTPEMRKAVRDLKPPYGVVIDFVEYPDYIGLRTYENQVMAMSEQRQVGLMEYMQMLRKIIESFGVKCHFDGKAGDPPRGKK